MSKISVSQEEIQLRKRARRRLVGAIALVLLAVVVLPMVLDGGPKQRPENINIQIPPIPPETTSQAVLPPGPAQSPESPTTVAPVPAEDAAQPGPAPPAPVPVAPAPEPLPAAPAAVPPPAAAMPSEKLVIQIGCFADAAKSRALAGQIKAQKVPAFSEPARERSCTRVRAGPFSSPEAAQRARERLFKLNLIPAPSEGKIVRRGE